MVHVLFHQEVNEIFDRGVRKREISTCGAKDENGGSGKFILCVGLSQKLMQMKINLISKVAETLQKQHRQVNACGQGQSARQSRDLECQAR